MKSGVNMGIVLLQQLSTDQGHHLPQIGYLPAVVAPFFQEIVINAEGQ